MNNLLAESNALGLIILAAATTLWFAADRLVRSSATRKTGVAEAHIIGPSALTIAEKLTTAILDPIGTITHGELSVVSVEPLDPGHDRNLRWFAGALQHTSDDPVARAIARLAVRGRVTDVEHVPGVGTRGAVDRHPVRVGRPDWIGVDAPDEGWGSTVAVEVDGRPMGHITVADTIREQAGDAIDILSTLGITVSAIAHDERTAAYLRDGLPSVTVLNPDSDHIAAERALGHRVAAVSRSQEGAMRLVGSDLAVSDGATDEANRIEMADVAVHHLARVLQVVRGAASRVRAIRRGVLAVTLVSILGLAVAPTLPLDIGITVAGLIALALAASLPLSRWR